MPMQSSLRLLARSFTAAALLCGLLAVVCPIAAQQPQAASALIPADKR